jgi:hypothetical protein
VGLIVSVHHKSLAGTDIIAGMHKQPNAT